MRQQTSRPVPLLIFLPLPRRFLVLAGDHVRVDFLGRSHRAMAQACGDGRQRDARGQQDRRMGVAQQVQRRAFGLGYLQPAEEQGHRSRDRVRLQHGAVGIRENQVQVGAVVCPVLPT